MNLEYASGLITAGLVGTPSMLGAYSIDFWTPDGGSYFIDFVPKMDEALP